jgi:hypothetical protein
MRRAMIPLVARHRRLSVGLRVFCLTMLVLAATASSAAAVVRRVVPNGFHLSVIGHTGLIQRALLQTQGALSGEGHHCGPTKYGTWVWHVTSRTDQGDANLGWTELLLPDGQPRHLKALPVSGSFYTAFTNPETIIDLSRSWINGTTVRVINRGATRQYQIPGPEMAFVRFTPVHGRYSFCPPPGIR